MRKLLTIAIAVGCLAGANVAQAGTDSEALLRQYAPQAWWSMRGWTCATLTDAAASFDPVTIALGQVWAPVARCARAVRERFLCALPELVLADREMLDASVSGAWRHRRTCLRMAVSSGAMGLGRSLLCGLGRWAYRRVGRLGTCVRQMLGNPELRILLDELQQAGCRALGRFAADTAMALLTARGTVAGMMGRWVKRLEANLSAYDWHALRRRLGATGTAMAVRTVQRLVRRHPACLPVPSPGPAVGLRTR